MNEIRLETHENRTAFAPGEIIAGVVTWALEKPPPQVEVRLIWYTQGKGDRDLRTAQTMTFDAPAQADAQIFKFTAASSPHSFSGKLISLQWAIEAVAGKGVEPVKMELVIAPQRREINLQHPPSGFAPGDQS